MNWLDILIIVYCVGAVVDMYDSFLRGYGPARVLVFAVTWPLTVLLAIYRKVTR